MGKCPNYHSDLHGVAMEPLVCRGGGSWCSTSLWAACFGFRNLVWRISTVAGALILQGGVALDVFVTSNPPSIKLAQQVSGSRSAPRLGR